MAFFLCVCFKKQMKQISAYILLRTRYTNFSGFNRDRKIAYNVKYNVSRIHCRDVASVNANDVIRISESARRSKV